MDDTILIAAHAAAQEAITAKSQTLLEESFAAYAGWVFVQSRKALPALIASWQCPIQAIAMPSRDGRIPGLWSVYTGGLSIQSRKALYRRLMAISADLTWDTPILQSCSVRLRSHGRGGLPYLHVDQVSSSDLIDVVACLQKGKIPLKT